MDDVANMDLVKEISSVPTLELLYKELERVAVTPGWIDREVPILWPEPRSKFVPAQWRYLEMKAGMDAAGRLIDVLLAERRNLVMRNPAPGNNFATTNTLVCAYQMLLPGERARSHRHSPHALRVILDAVGSYTIVDGVKTPMETGDVVLTPGWCWHGHGHEGDGPAYWIDGLDVPLTHLLEPVFFEEHPNQYEDVVSVAPTSPFRFTRDSIAMRLDRSVPDPEGFHGARIALEAPDMPTMGLWVERLEAGATTRRQRSTADHVFVVVEGQGESLIGGQRFDWRFGDTFVVPSWNKFEHRAKSDSVLFDLSDEPLKRFAHFYRFEAD
jgi:gentisate 1,2-dioxygenase